MTIRVNAVNRIVMHIGIGIDTPCTKRADAVSAGKPRQYRGIPAISLAQCIHAGMHVIAFSIEPDRLPCR
ncbi:hypothetical protein D3C80_2016960 [compost metagenome]